MLQTRSTPFIQWTEINTAGWSAFDKRAPLTSFAKSWLIKPQQEANMGVCRSEFFAGRDLYTALPARPTSTGAQELLRITPLPGTLLLLVGGIVGRMARSKGQ